MPMATTYLPGCSRKMSSCSLLLLLAYSSFCSAFLTSFNPLQSTTTRWSDAILLYAKNKKQPNINDDNTSNESPFFFASVSNDNSTNTVGAVGTAAAAVGGAVVLSEGGE